MQVKTKHKIWIFIYSTIVIGLLGIFCIVFEIKPTLNWIVTARIILLGILFTALTAAYHITASKFSDSEEKTHHFFDLPLNIFATIFAAISIIQIIQDVEDLQDSFASYTKNVFNNYTKTVTIQGWEDTTMKHPELNQMYQKIFTLNHEENPTYISQSQWEKKFPGIAYIPFEGHEQQWHYATKFIQQMIIITKMFELEKKFSIKGISESNDTLFGPYAGWMTSFRMFLKNDIVRNVWEQTASHNTTPTFAAWVKFHITDVIDNQPNFFKDHKEHWHQQVQLILKNKSGKNNGIEPKNGL